MASNAHQLNKTAIHNIQIENTIAHFIVQTHESEGITKAIHLLPDLRGRQWGEGQVNMAAAAGGDHLGTVVDRHIDKYRTHGIPLLIPQF